MSLPSLRPTSSTEDRSKDDADEEDEYEHRAQLLENAITQNQRNRQLLQRVSASVKEYDQVLSRMSKSLDFSYTTLPNDLLEALPQELASVTGYIRGSSGITSIDVVHETLQKQLGLVRNFRLDRIRAGEMIVEGGLLNSSLKRLFQSLARLEAKHPAMMEKAQVVSDALTRVKNIHAQVKAEYNQAVAYTSAVYPEMSQIVTLEDSYKNHYQQFWDFGMDAATFLLDAVIPFWRNYGKIIGVDVQDFLIIPWYRNEFTGETKRYPITQLPQRSLRHWIGLIVFFDLAITMLGLQCRGVWMTLRYYSLSFGASPALWGITVPLYWGVVLSQFVAVVVEAAIVAAQLAVILWWLGWWARVLD